MFKKIVAFIIGFILGVYLSITFVQWAYIRLDYEPFDDWMRWLVLGGCVLTGLLNGKFFSNPTIWWKLTPRLRLVIVVSVIWIAASYLMQDEYDEDLKIILLPPLSLVALHFAERVLVRNKL